MNIVECIRTPGIFGHFLGRDLSSWRPWLAALKCLYGLEVKSKAGRRLVKECAGRDATGLPTEGFRSALFLTGRRSGKSKIAAVVGAFEAALCGHEEKLSKGEKGYLPIVSPTTAQSRIVYDYLRSVFDTPLLRPELVRETVDGGFELRNGIVVKVMPGDFRSLRGYSLVGAVLDEVCFHGLQEESKIKSDTELVTAIKPGLATIAGSRLIAISSPYRKAGWAYSTFQRNFANPRGRTLVWRAPSRVMNSTLPQAVVDEAMQEDLAAAKAEYLAEWRQDISAFVDRALIEACVVKERHELYPSRNTSFFAFVDVSGGRGDDSGLAVAHRSRDGTKAVIAYAKRWKSPADPFVIVREMAEVLRSYHITTVTGDNYSGEFVAGAFRAHGINYRKCEKPKSELYLALLPRLSGHQIELLDDEFSIGQLAGLERRTRSGGRDSVDHAHGAKDDLANAIAGAVDLIFGLRPTVGVIDLDEVADAEDDETDFELVGTGHGYADED